MISLYGTVENTYGQLQMSNPVWEPATKNFLTGRLVPIYPATEGLKPSLLYRLIQNNLALYRPALTDLIPEEIRRRHGLWPRAEAFEKIHFPQSLEDYQRAHDTLAFEELLLFQIGVALEKQRIGERPGRSLTISDERLEEFFGVLPFKLTRASRARHRRDSRGFSGPTAHEPALARGCGLRQDGGRDRGVSHCGRVWVPSGVHGPNGDFSPAALPKNYRVALAAEQAPQGRSAHRQSA
jgi:hypothetical protein